MDLLPVVFRFLHIISAVTLVGGVLAWVFGFLPALTALSAEVRQKVENAAAAAWRPLVLSSILGLLVSGTWNFTTNFLHREGLQPAWHPVFGVKILLALHVFGVAMLATKPGNTKRTRQLTGVAVSGVVIVLLSALLRFLSK
jgi:hypothetical protein